MFLLAEADAAANAVVSAIVTHVLVGGVAATWLLVVCKVGELIGNDTCESRIAAGRRVQYDSDAMVGGGLAAIGAVIGLVVAIALVSGGADVAAYWPASAVAGGLIGLVVPLPLVRYFARQYLDRAALNLQAGSFKEAIEDACEARRLAKSMTPEAARIEGFALIKSGRRERGEQLLHSVGIDYEPDFGGDARSYGNSSYSLEVEDDRLVGHGAAYK
jgi:hypothetical protein